MKKKKIEKEPKILPLAGMEKILKQAGAVRISNGAKETLRDILIEAGIELSKKAVKMSLHAGRKTIQGGDLRLAKNA